MKRLSKTWPVSARRGAFSDLYALAALLCLWAVFPTLAADPNKTIRVAFPAAETTFDPQVIFDIYSFRIAENINESMLQYDYLARPLTLIPNTLESMPELSADGTVFLFHLKKNIYFTPDPVFNGTRRELTAADYAYSIKRIFDPKVKSQWIQWFEGKIVGADELRERAKKDNKFDYDTPIPGLEVIDRYTLRMRLKAPDRVILYLLARPSTAAVAREVVEAYGDDFSAHPVGTGPYVLKEYKRSSKIVLEANPDYREVVFHPAPSHDPWDQEIIKAIGGRRLPIVGRIEVYIVEEAQPTWLGFLNGEFDFISVPSEFVNIAAPEGKLAPYLERRGIKLHLFQDPAITYTFFNMEDPVLGGYTAEKVALRRAICLAYNINEEIQIIRKNYAVAAQSPIGPGVPGYDPDFHSPTLEYNPAKAKALLDMFGYLDRNGDGYRELPDGTPLALEMGSPPDSQGRQFDELWLKSMNAVGIQLRFKKERFPDLLKLSGLGKLQLFSEAFNLGYPDADNFMQLLYGSNSGKANSARFRLPEYDRMYERARRIPDSPERTQLYQQMTKLMLVYAPWKLGVHRRVNFLIQPWISGYKEHPILRTTWRYLDVDVAQRKATR